MYFSARAGSALEGLCAWLLLWQKNNSQMRLVGASCDEHNVNISAKNTPNLKNNQSILNRTRLFFRYGSK